MSQAHPDNPRHGNLRIDEDRLWASLMDAAKIGRGDHGGNRRLALTDEDREMRDVFVQWCEASGCSVSVDQAGNIRARYEGQEDLPPVLIGSHLDTQVAGGRFDGILGVLAGLEIIRVLKDAGIRPKRPIEVVNWSNEEGARFSPPMAASRVFSGEQDIAWLHGLTDDDGFTFGGELARIGYLGDVDAGPRPIDSYFELHIEQGPDLEAAGVPLGIVTGGYTAYGLIVKFLGTTAHSGPTPMEKRSNALVGAAKLIDAVNDIGWKHAPIGKSTSSRLVIWPNKPGILPSEAEVTVDVRHIDPAVTEEMRVEMHAALATAAEEARVGFEIVTDWIFGDVAFDQELTALVRQTAADIGVPAMDIHSQAGHDAYCVSDAAPAILLFSPCIDGITHNEAEDVVPEDTYPSVNVLLQAVLRRADRD